MNEDSVGTCHYCHVYGGRHKLHGTTMFFHIECLRLWDDQIVRERKANKETCAERENGHEVAS